MSYVGNKPAQTTIPVDDSVTTAMVQDDAVTADKVANAINTSIAANTSKVTNATHTGDVTGATALTIAAGAVDVAMLSATGSASSTTVLYGDGTWKAEPVTDTSGLRNDISTLALHSAIADNKAAYNLSNSFIDQFEDSTGIDALTTSQRNASEYVVSGTTASHAATVNLFNASPFEDSAVYSATTGTAANCFDGDRASAGSGGASGIVGFPQTFKIDFGSGNAYIINEYGIWSPYDFNGPYFGAHVISGSQNDSSWTSLRSHSGAQTNNASISLYTFTNTTAYRYYRCVVTDNAGGYANEIFLGDWSGYNTNGTDVETPSATGNFTSTTQTALASVSSMGIVVLYKNNSGTASLNTDIVAQVSANGGTNYANATLVAGGTFSTGINIAAVSGVSVTAGTTPKYKISFANQSAGVKETQVHGVALLY